MKLDLHMLPENPDLTVKSVVGHADAQGVVGFSDELSAVEWMFEAGEKIKATFKKVVFEITDAGLKICPADFFSDKSDDEEPDETRFVCGVLVH